MTRVVCDNTLEYGRAEGAAKYKVQHRTSVDFGNVAVALGLEKARTDFEDTIAQMRRLAETQIPNKLAIDATAELFVAGWRDMDTAARDKQMAREGGALAAIGRLALNGRAKGSDLDGVTGTAWGWLNAVTEYVDHHSNTRGENKGDNRFNSAMFGRGADTKQRAYQMAGAMATHFGRPTQVAVAGLESVQAEVATHDGASLLGSFLIGRKLATT